VSQSNVELSGHVFTLLDKNRDGRLDGSDFVSDFAALVDYEKKFYGAPCPSQSTYASTVPI
jgi:hypothetical protein